MFVQDFFQFFRRIFHCFFSISSAQVGMHHISLYGAGPHDGHFYYQIIKTFGFQPGQHGLLGAAFYLKNADGICMTNHFIHDRIILRDIGQR